MKIRVGIIFGGFSKEREISFAGGRTVYDNLDKSLFEAVPVFVDSFGNFVLLDWEYIYKGSIRDFYPPAEFIPDSSNEFQVYAESLGLLDMSQQEELINKIGKRIKVDELKQQMDFAFLCLHGPYGEDGKIQGLLEYLEIPYSGSGILPSAIGIDKVTQKKLMINAGFQSPQYITISRKEWFSKTQNFFSLIKDKVGFPAVVKSATQGSSIGITILREPNEEQLATAINKSFFAKEINAKSWSALKPAEKVDCIRILTDIREGIGIPVTVSGKKEPIYHPEKLLSFVEDHFTSGKGNLLIEGLDAESEIIVEGFIEGKEFSCIVIQNEDQNRPVVALPPTEIRKGSELFDYRSKYLPGLSRKITPIDLPADQISNIRKECERLFAALRFDVYARIDGFIKKDGTIFLNDPNTTSGMMPSSFFFHQAAEIGLNPSQFLTYIIRTSLLQRIKESKNKGSYDHLLIQLDDLMQKAKANTSDKIKVAVLLGGFSAERHISVESGRNIYEKLSSSTKYQPIPVFLTGDESNHEMYQVPVNILLKDNADDIKEKIEHYKVHDIIKEVISEATGITKMYASLSNLAQPKRINYDELAKIADVVFIALHGRPGEDGAVQQQLEKIGLPYNGSEVKSSQTTINKFETNEILRKNGLLVANHLLVKEEDWNKDASKVINQIESEIKFPLIAKPVDDGCSAAVKKIKSKEELEAFAKLIFRKTEDLDVAASEFLKIKLNEEFPKKRVFLIEELISAEKSKKFLEITGGMLTKYNDKNEVIYEVFEASEALSEGEVLSLEEKFLAGQGQNITPARYDKKESTRSEISSKVKKELEKAAKILDVTGYSRIDAFTRIFDNNKVEVVFIEVNSLPGMTPATCIFHQAAINGYKPYDFIDQIIAFAFERQKIKQPVKTL